MNHIKFIGATSLLALANCISSATWAAGAIDHGRVESLESNWQTIPSGFKFADPQTIVREIIEAQKVAPQVDQYSKSAEVASHNQFIQDSLRLQNPFIIELPVGRHPFKYDPDAEVMRVTLFASNFDVKSKLYQLKLDKHRLASIYKDKGTYTASNNFGKTVKVKESEATEISLAIPRDQNHQPFSFKATTTSHLSNSAYSFEFRLDRDIARRDGEKLQVVAIFSPEAPYIQSYSQDIEPTISAPFHLKILGQAIYGRLVQVWVVNPVSREIVAKY